jgi:hypothetical protein
MACHEYEHTWNPKVVMIDKCEFLASAVKDVWPNTVIWLCQFHLGQVILRLKGYKRGFLRNLYTLFCKCQRVTNVEGKTDQFLSNYIIVTVTN